jgi:hypothetical protein
MLDPFLTPPSRFSRWMQSPLDFRVRRSLAMGALLSIVLHILILLLLPERKQIDGEPVGAPPPLEVRLTSPQVAASPQAVPPSPTPPTPPRERILAVPKPITKSPLPPVYVPPEKTEPTPRPPEPVPTPRPPTDAAPSMMARVEAARARREAEESAIAQMNAEARGSGRDPRSAAIESNLKSLGQSRDGTSGVFQILSKGHRVATFSFRGWTTDRGNSYRQVIEVDAGLGGNIDLAIIRRMIQLIREHYQGSFQWDSHRLGRVVTLSARMEDNVGLEGFLMQEFGFTSQSTPQSAGAPNPRN